VEDRITGSELGVDPGGDGSIIPLGREKAGGGVVSKRRMGYLKRSGCTIDGGREPWK